MATIGVVVIGRNEGSRLEACLRSLAAHHLPVVYADSGSTDGSVERARALGADVVVLSPPFTAAKGRNEGFARLPRVDYVQFLDGDTEVVPGWVEAARNAMADDVVAVCGRRRERHPDVSVYNKLCDIEWNTPVGETDVFGGDVLVRSDAFREVGGYDASLIAGEDPDLAVRLKRATGKRILRIDVDMTVHDAAMTSFSQWWKRAFRGGHAFAEGAARHDGFWQKEVRSNFAWGAIAAAGAGLALPTLGASAAVTAAMYGALYAKIRRDARRRGVADADVYAAFTAIAKIPQALGQARYWADRVRGKKSSIIEYKRL